MGKRGRLHEEEENTFIMKPISKDSDPEIIRTCLGLAEYDYGTMIGKMDLETLKKLKKVINQIHKFIPN